MCFWIVLMLGTPVEPKRDRTTLFQAIGLAGRGYRLPTGAACAPGHEGVPLVLMLR
jgi:hypothetical protein